MFELKIITHFAAAHQLAMVSQKCEELHGHNWKIEVCVQGERLNQAGVLVDFGELKKHVRNIMTTLDHKFLNELEMFDNNIQASSENIALYIAKQLQSKIEDNREVRVSRVTAWESENASATYIC